MKRYLVTGGTGFIGSALVVKLLAMGHFVRVLDNDLRGSGSKFAGMGNNLELVKADIRDAAEVHKAAVDIDSVVHLAYLNGTEYFYSHPDFVLDIAVRGMINVLDACMKHGVKELILASSSEVYQTPPTIPTNEAAPFSVPDPLNPRYSYGGGKMISELMAINYGRKFFERVIIFRPHNVVGPDMGTEHVIPQFALRLKKLAGSVNADVIEFPIQGNGKETRSYVFIDDFVEGVYLLLEKGEHLNIYNIGTQEEVSVETLAHEVARVYKKKIRIVPSQLSQGSTLRRCPDISKITKLGYQPSVSFARAVEKTVLWYKDNDIEPRSID